MTAVAIFLVVAVVELLWPRQALSDLTKRRWIGNLALFGCFAVMLAVADRIPQVGAWIGLGATGDAWSLLPRLRLSPWVEIPAAVLLLDLVAYALHRGNHAFGWLWRLHAVHHSDPEVDVTTTWRQHPLSNVIQALAMAGAVALLGISAAAFGLYRSLDAIVQTVAHANLALPPRLSAALSRVLVTPEFHRLHHSPRMAETNSNYGQVFSVWDRLLGTARVRSLYDARAPEFGLEAFRDARSQGPLGLLAQPFLAQRGLPDSAPAERLP